MKVKKTWYHVDLSGQEGYEECYVFPIGLYNSCADLIDCILLGYDTSWMSEMWLEREVPVIMAKAHSKVRVGTIKVAGRFVPIYNPEKHIKRTITITRTVLYKEYLKDGRVVTESTMKRKNIPSIALGAVPELIAHCKKYHKKYDEENELPPLTFIFYQGRWHYQAGQITLFSSQMEEV